MILNQLLAGLRVTILVAMTVAISINATADISDLRTALDRGDFSTARDLAERGTIMGDAFSQYVLGSMLVTGDHIEMNVERGVHLLETSGRQGNADALGFLGLLHYYKSVPDSEIWKAWMYMRLAIQFGSKNAGAISAYIVGEMTEEDYSLGVIALENWRKETGHTLEND